MPSRLGELIAQFFALVGADVSAALHYAPPVIGRARRGSRAALLELEIANGAARSRRGMFVPHMDEDACLLIRGTAFVPVMHLRQAPGFYPVRGEAGTPESRSIGLDLVLALGARVERDGSITAVDTDEMLGFGASQIPFVAHDDGARAMMGAKNAKAALPLVRAEPPLVRTSREELARRVLPTPLTIGGDGEVIDVTDHAITVSTAGATTATSLLGRDFDAFGVIDLMRPLVQVGDRVS